MKSSYTKAERRKIYERALERLVSSAAMQQPAVLCYLLSEAAGAYISVNGYKKHRARFPEFWAFKPRHNEGDCGAWWANDLYVFFDYDSRISCLLFCIEMTKDE